MNNKQRYEALTRLVRSCKSNPENVKHLQNILTNYLESSALIAVDVAQESGDPIGQALAESLGKSDNTSLLFDIYDKLPTNSVALMEVNLIIAKRMVELARLNTTSDCSVLAEAIASYAEALVDMGQRKQALEEVQESACLYQRSINKSILLRSQESINSYSVFSRCLMDNGQLKDAILIQEYIIDSYIEFPVSDENTMTGYANALLTISSYLKMGEDYQQAIYYGHEALDALQTLSGSKSQYRYIKHRIIRNLADCYDSNDNLSQASNLLKDTLQIIDDLSAESEDRYELELIDTLESLSGIESRRGNLDKAKEYAGQAIRRMDVRYLARNEAFASSYSSLLTNLALVELYAGDLLSSQQKMNQAVAILDPLVEQYPKRFSINLAAVLNNRIEVFLALNEYEDAINDAEYSLRLYRSQIDQEANSAMALNTLANALMQSGEVDTAQPYMLESIEIYKQLVSENTNYQTDLALTLGTLALIKEQLEVFEEALEIADKSLMYWDSGSEGARFANAMAYHKVMKVRLSCLIELEEYAKAMTWSEYVLQHLADNPHLSPQIQADTFSLQANLLYSLGQYEEAEEISIQGIELLRTLAIDEIPSYKVDLADALGNLCFLQAERNQEQALETVKEAARLYQELPNDNYTVPMVSNIAVILQNLGSMAQACEQYPLALDSFQKAVLYQQQIVDVDESYRYELCTLLQLLLNIQVIIEDVEFYTTLEMLRQLLEQLPFDQEIAELRENLLLVEASFIKPIRDKRKADNET